MDAVFRPGKDTPFSLTTIDDLSMEGSVENPIVLDEEEDKENAPPPPPSTPKSVRPTDPPRLQRSPAFGARVENVPEYVFRNLLQKVLLCLYFNKNYKYCVSVYRHIFQKLVEHVWDKSSCSIEIISFTSSSKFLHISSSYWE